MKSMTYFFIAICPLFSYSLDNVLKSWTGTLAGRLSAHTQKYITELSYGPSNTQLRL